MRILGIDYGSKKIGLALASGEHIMPLKTIENRKGHLIEELAIKQIRLIINEERIEKIVIGNSNLKQEISQELKDFENKLKNENNLPEIVFVNEFKTTDTSIKAMINLGISQKKRKADDAYAACIIIANYLAEKS